MGLETATYIDDLVTTNPVDATDQTATLGDHVRLLKTTLKNTWPNVNAAVTPSDEELNYLVGVTSAVQTQLNAKAAAGANTDITSLAGLTTALSVAQGGTGLTTLAAVVQAVLDALGTTAGDLLYRGADDWAVLGKGTEGTVLRQGAAAPEWSAFACLAWVKFNGTTTPPTILAGGNVSDVTRNATGDYTVTFTVEMPDENYLHIFDANDAQNNKYTAVSSATTTSIRFTTRNPSGAAINTNPVGVAIFR